MAAQHPAGQGAPLLDHLPHAQDASDAIAGRDRTPILALFAADTISVVGNAIALVAIPWFVLQSTGSAALTGVAAFFTWLPVAISAFFGGPLVDRLGFRRTSVAADLASAGAVAAIPALELAGGIELWQLFALVFLGALLDAPGTTARRALIPDLAQLAQMRLERATSVTQIIRNVAIMVGAPLAGVLVATVGATTALWIDAASFVVSAAIVRAFVPGARRSAPAAQRRYLDDLREGIRLTWGDPFIRAVVLTVLLTHVLDAPLSPVLLPVFVDQAFGSAEHLGLLLGAFGAAALAAGAAFAAIGHRLPRRLTFVLCFIVVSVPYLVLATTPSFPLTLAAIVLFGVATAPINPILNTVGYERIPAEARGRVLGTITAGAFSAIPLGMLVGGVVVETLGIGGTLLAIGVCYLAVTSYGLVNPAFRVMDAAPAVRDEPGS